MRFIKVKRTRRRLIWVERLFGWAKVNKWTGFVMQCKHLPLYWIQRGFYTILKANVCYDDELFCRSISKYRYKEDGLPFVCDTCITRTTWKNLVFIRNEDMCNIEEKAIFIINIAWVHEVKLLFCPG